MAREHSGGTGYPEWEFLWRAALFSPFSPWFRIKSADSTLRNAENTKLVHRNREDTRFASAISSLFAASLSFSAAHPVYLCRRVATSRFYGNSIHAFVRPWDVPVPDRGKRLLRSNLFLISRIYLLGTRSLFSSPRRGTGETEFLSTLREAQTIISFLSHFFLYDKSSSMSLG